MVQQNWSEQAGQGMVEYGLLVLLIAATVLTAFFMMGSQFGGIYSSVSSGI